MRSLVLALLISSFSISSIYASMPWSSEVSCSTYGADALSCAQCFDWGTDYVWDTVAKAFDDYFINSSTTNDYIIRRDSGLSAWPVPLQSSVTVGTSADYGVNYPSTIFWFDYSGDVALLFASTSTHIAKMNGGVLFTAVAPGANANKPALRYEYNTRVQQYDFVTSSTSGPLIDHKECAFVSPRWCGDGIISNGETCDEGSINGQPWKCNTACTDTTPLVTTCDGISVSPSSGGSAPHDVAVSCSATNASSYRIDCGNGVSNLASTALCRYTTAGTYTPKCTVNGTISSPACQSTVNVSAPPPTPKCSTTITGVVTNPLSTATPGLCDIGSLDITSFGVSVVTNTTYYTWKCKNGTELSPPCSANYTPVTPASPDLKLKKYVNNVDAQNNGTAVNIPNNSTFTYTVTVENVGLGSLTPSLTTVYDPLPAGVTLTATPLWSGWSCTGNSGDISWSCTRNNSLAPGWIFPTITVSVRVASSTTYLTNTAEVSNPNDVTTSNNTDPAVIKVIPVVTPACNTISVNPTSGNIPLSSSVTCNTTSATTIQIDCGNGQSFPNTSATCTYTTVGTFTPKCTVDGTLSPASCQGSVTTTSVPVQPVCGPNTGVQVSPVTASTSGICPTGTSVVGFTPSGISPILYTWNCKDNITNLTSPSCNASYTPPIVPTCNSISVTPTGGTIPLTTNISCNTSNATTTNIICGNGQAFAGPTANCTYTTVGTFSPQCKVNATITSPACQWTVITTPPPPTSPSVSIKKYAGGLDGQTATGALPVTPGATFNYTYEVRNTGSGTATWVTVTDTLPRYVSVTALPTGTDWTCSTGTITVSTILYHTVICTYRKALLGYTVAPVITVPAKLDSTVPSGSELRNIAYVCRAGSTIPECNPGCIDPNNPTCTPPPPPPNCSPRPGSPDYDPACVVPNSTPSCGNLGSFPSGSTLSPSIDVTYTCSATGAIPVPANLEYSIKCSVWDTSSGSIYTGSNIRVCRTPSTNSTSQTITCAVRDKTTGIVFSGSEVWSCNVVKTTSGWGGGGTTLLYVPKCVNGIVACATLGSYADLALCKIGEGRDCYSNETDCNTIGKPTVSCGWGGGGGYCGDGVLQSGEECDVYGATWCVACKINTLTYPGANPITDLWMIIPTLSKTRLGYNWLDAQPGKIRFEDNGMVLGVNTRAFTIADKVGFGIKTVYQVPLMVEVTKRVCLTSLGISMNTNTVCTNFGDLAPLSMKSVIPGYVTIGNGDYQVRQANGTYIQYRITGNPNSIDLFRWANTYTTSNGSMKLSEAFYARQITTPPDGVLSLYHLSTTGGLPIDLAALRVRVSGAMVGGTSSTVNRKLESYINSTSLVNIFLSGFKGYTTTTSSTNAISGGTATAVNTVNINTTSAWNTIVRTIADMEALAVNGNKNILALKNGNLTIECTVGITATELLGVRTVIVENGDLIINCNNGYGSSDISSSWAFIVKNGNIRVASTVTNIAGIYVAIGTPGATACDGTGNLCSVGNLATNTILRVNGSMYGNAKPLFDSRLYVRGTNAYDILTTGVVISYSNRALVSPPPLLSQYLNNYNVTRVVKQ